MTLRARAWFSLVASIGLAFGVVAVGVGPAKAADIRYVVTDYGPASGSGAQVVVARLNSSGDGAGAIYPAGGSNPHAYVVRSGTGTDLDTLGGSQAQTCAINDAGNVAGYSGITNDTGTHAFVSSGNQLIDLGSLNTQGPGGGFSYMFCFGSGREMNNSGEVVGLSSTAHNGTHPFLYSGGVMHDLGVLGTGDDARAWLINESGQVSGDSRLFPFDPECDSGCQDDRHAFLYSGGPLVDLGTLGGTRSSPEDLNDSGQVVGMSSLQGDSLDHPFLYSNGGMTDLEEPSGASGNGNAIAINNAGDVLLTSDTGTARNVVFVWSNGVYTQVTSDTNATAAALNNTDDVVGWTYTTRPEGWVWTNGQQHLLNDVLVPGSGVDAVSYPFDINDAGQITAFADMSGVTHSILLTPVSGNDQTSPQITLTTPPDGAQYTIGQQVNADYSCQDEVGGSGVASCSGDVASGQPIDTSTAGSHTFTVNATDNAGNPASTQHSYEVLAGNVPPEPVPASGGTVTTDPGGLGASADAPVQTAIQVPATGSGGTVSVTSGAVSDPAPTGYSFYGTQVNVSSSVTGQVGSPLVLTFTIEGTTPGADPSTLTVVRTEGGVSTTLGLCSGPTGSALPNPCMTAPVRIQTGPAAGDIQVSVYTTHASDWNVGKHNAYAVSGFFPPVVARPTLNPTSAGSTVSVKFSLGGNQGLNIFARGYPSSGSITCGTNPSIDPTERTSPLPPSGLTYSSKTHQYTYAWKTSKSWAGSCRQLEVEFNDGSVLRANFKFK